MSKWVEFNVNEYVRVKLTPEGIKLLEREHDEVFGPLINKYPFRMPEIDKDGWTRFQAWDLMNKLGKHCHLGATNPFETTIQFEVKQPAQETSAAPDVMEEQCAWCKGVGRIGIPGATCNFCGGEGVRRRDASLNREVNTP